LFVGTLLFVCGGETGEEGGKENIMASERERLKEIM